MQDPWGPYIAHSPNMPPDVVVQQVLDTVLTSSEVRCALDLGCGSGRHLDLFRRRAVRCIGVDSSPACRRGSAAELIVADLSKPLPFASGTADFVLLWGVFVHLPCDCHQDLFGELPPRTGTRWDVAAGHLATRRLPQRPRHTDRPRTTIAAPSSTA